MRKSNFRVVFVGSSALGLRCLKMCVNLPAIKIVGVIGGLKRFSISYRPEGVTNYLFEDLEEWAKSLGISAISFSRSVKEALLLEKIRSWQPDAFLVVGWYHMIPKSWRVIAPAYGLHASLLPKYRGGAPLVWAMINGESHTGITLFQMDDGVDTGPIVRQVAEPIHEQDTIATLYSRIEERGVTLLREALPALADGTAELRQQSPPGTHPMPQRSPEDGRIDWQESSQFIDRFIRAQTKPYPGAFTLYNGERIVVWAANQWNQEASQSVEGTVLHDKGICWVVCGKGMLRLDEIEIKGYSFFGKQIARMLPPLSLFQCPRK